MVAQAGCRQILNHQDWQKRQTAVPIRVVATAVRRGTPLWLLLTLAVTALAQELQPRAYLPSPVGLGFFGISYSNNRGGLLFDPSLPIEDGHVNANSAAISLGGTLGVFGRTSQILAVLPYVQADLSGSVAGIQGTRSRSGLTDALFRFAMNIHGAPAMRLSEFTKYRPHTIIGASISMSTPTGQYDPNALINLGTNRWAFKPEIGISRSVGKWDFEGDFGVWLYTKNTSYYGQTYRGQNPLGSVQAHVIRVLSRRAWAAFDATYFTGGRSYVGTTIKADYEGSTRIGGTFGFLLTPRQALRFAYFNGVTARIGTDISSISVAYQVIWNRGR